MADIELVIKLDEEQYEFIKQNITMANVKDYPAFLYAICEHVKDGTPLPKGHGRLIDADKIISEATERMKYPANHKYMECVIAHMKLAPTIIEADTESEE